MRASGKVIFRTSHIVNAPQNLIAITVKTVSTMRAVKTTIVHQDTVAAIKTAAVALIETTSTTTAETEVDTAAIGVVAAAVVLEVASRSTEAWMTWEATMGNQVTTIIQTPFTEHPYSLPAKSHITSPCACILRRFQSIKISCYTMVTEAML